jgi:hypothetical protein
MLFLPKKATITTKWEQLMDKNISRGMGDKIKLTLPIVLISTVLALQKGKTLQT